jgi:hypothetical protein
MYIPNPIRGQRTYQARRWVICKPTQTEAEQILVDNSLNKESRGLTAVAAAVPAAEYGMNASTILIVSDSGIVDDRTPTNSE